MSAELEDYAAVPTPPQFTMEELADALAPDFNAIDSDNATLEVLTAKEIEELLQRGIKFHGSGRVKEAMECYHEVLRHDPENKRALYFTAIAVSQRKRPEAETLAMMEHAVEGLANIPEAQYNLGILYHRMGRVDDSIPRFKRAIELKPSMIEAKTSLGGAYLNKGDKELGRKWLTAAAKTHTHNIDSVYSRAFARLTVGDYYGGFVDYDERWKSASFLVENRRDFGPKVRFWNGKSIPGKVLYVHTEQGAGDILMFSRFLPMIKERSRCRRLILEVGASLVSHLSQIEGVDDVIASNTPTPEQPHFFFPYMTMMRKLGVFSRDKIPHRDGWLSVTPREVPVSDSTRLRVGISWAGSKAHTNDRYRSIDWALFRDTLLNDSRLADRVEWYSFQVGERARDIDDGTPPSDVLRDLTHNIVSFEDTAAYLASMDLLVSVDTATVHACASLKNRPNSIVFIPAAPDWRWLLDGEHTPWYGGMTLVRQNEHTDWTTPLKRAADLIVSRYEL